MTPHGDRTSLRSAEGSLSSAFTIRPCLPLRRRICSIGARARHAEPSKVDAQTIAHFRLTAQAINKTGHGHAEPTRIHRALFTPLQYGRDLQAIPWTTEETWHRTPTTRTSTPLVQTMPRGKPTSIIDLISHNRERSCPVPCGIDLEHAQADCLTTGRIIRVPA